MSKKYHSTLYNETKNSIWKKLLIDIYTIAPVQNTEREDSQFTDNNNPLAKKLNISGTQLYAAIMFLREQKLIEYRQDVLEPKISTLVLTEKGFDVIFELEKQERGNRIQISMLIFTAILAASAFFEYFIQYFDFNKNFLLLPLFLMGGALILTLIYSHYIVNTTSLFH